MKKSEFKAVGSRERAQSRQEYLDPLPSKTDQSFRNEVSINSIMAKYAKTGQITHLAKREGMYADVSSIPDLQGAFDQVNLASAAFMAMPAKLREELGNDPSRLPAFLQDERNREKAIEYGLIDKPKVVPLELPPAPAPAPTPTPVPPVPKPS